MTERRVFVRFPNGEVASHHPTAMARILDALILAVVDAGTDAMRAKLASAGIVVYETEWQDDPRLPPTNTRVFP